MAATKVTERITAWAGIVCAIGIAFAVSLCLSTSRGQFNPGVTIHAVVFRGFPRLRAFRHIVAQLLGAYIACLVVYAQYKTFIHAAINALEAKGVFETTMFTPSDPAGIFELYIDPDTSLGDFYKGKFISDFVYGLVIFATTHPEDSPSMPTAMSWLTSMTYGIVVWGSSSMGLATNPARDLGSHLAVLTLFGRAPDHGNSAMLVALTSVVAMLLAGEAYKRFYGFFFDEPGSMHVTAIDSET